MSDMYGITKYNLYTSNTFHSNGDVIVHVKAGTAFFFTLCFVEERCSIEHILVFRCVFVSIFLYFCFSRSCYFGYFRTIFILFFLPFLWCFGSVGVW